MKKRLSVALVTQLVLCIHFGLFASNCRALEGRGDESVKWTESFDLDDCDFSSVGRNAYFVLEPGYQLVLEGIEGKDTLAVWITVLNETRTIGDVETRAVEEREVVNGKVVEISKNFYAICTRANSIFYFGEEVDIFKDGRLVSQSSEWRADAEGASVGLMMPGIVLLGARYYQEIAPGVAMDRAEILSDRETVETPAGTFEKCLKIEETTPLEPTDKDYKYYAPGIGLIRDEDLLLKQYSFVDR
ncbi:MAG: hypothetical protein AMJ46_03975 [Latescibacteria bacterium DG_63]|nr:MAG: hypothetical protein AMJ46_03975 [Latescibacteria bacterium DG_63]